MGGEIEVEVEFERGMLERWSLGATLRSMGRVDMEVGVVADGEGGVGRRYRGHLLPCLLVDQPATPSRVERSSAEVPAISSVEQS